MQLKYNEITIEIEEKRVKYDEMAELYNETEKVVASRLKKIDDQLSMKSLECERMK